MGEDGRFSGASSEEEEQDEPSELARIEQSQVFQFVVIGVILLNTLLMACEADALQEVPLYNILDNVFLAFFVCELSFRLIAYKCKFFTLKKDRGWNIFDFVIVVLGVVDAWIIGPFLSDQYQMSKLVMAFRVLRIARVLRAFRLFRHFKKLRILAQGLIASMQSVVWVTVLFLLVMFVYAIIITSIAGKNWQSFGTPEEQEIVKEKFGSILASMETLFLFLTCDDWSTPARIVNKKYPIMEVVWVTYIVIGAFTLLSLLTGLMADKMNQVRTEEEQKEKVQKVAKLEEFIRELQVLFNKADTSGDAKVNADEFRQMMCDRSHSEKMEQWGVPALKPGEALEVFNALDRSQDGELSWEEFRDGLVQLSQPFTTKDIMWLEASVIKLDRVLRSRKDTDPGIEWDRKLNRVHARASLIHERLELLERELDEFFQNVGYFPRV